MIVPHNAEMVEQAKMIETKVGLGLEVVSGQPFQTCSRQLQKKGCHSGFQHQLAR